MLPQASPSGASMGGRTAYQGASRHVTELVDALLAQLNPREQLGLLDHLSAVATTRRRQLASGRVLAIEEGGGSHERPRPSPPNPLSLVRYPARPSIDGSATALPRESL